MQWREFDPGNDKLRAEGPGYIFTSRFVRSIGLCLEYTSTESGISQSTSLGSMLQTYCLPISGMSDLAFGVVPGNNKLSCWDRPVGSLGEITDWLDFFDNTRGRKLHLSQALLVAEKVKPGWLPGFNIIPLTARNFSREETILCNIPKPNMYSSSLLRTQQGLRVFSHRLRGHCKASSITAPLTTYLQRMLVLLDSLEKIRTWTAHDSTWACVPSFTFSQRSVKSAFAYQTSVHRALDEIEGYLIDINVDLKGSMAGDNPKRKTGFCYDTLLVEHIRQAIILHQKRLMQKNPELDPVVESSDMKKELDSSRAWLDQAMNDYWNHLPELAQRVAYCTGCEVQLASNVQIMMNFCAFRWHHCHRLLGRRRSCQRNGIVVKCLYIYGLNCSIVSLFGHESAEE
ncbi:hypothetical protein B0J14DRAFT_660572 [Halenospora varia]|nr:hypothetical protein B0J14DRAFT_660572 [Halenospora varia]